MSRKIIFSLIGLNLGLASVLAYGLAQRRVPARPESSETTVAPLASARNRAPFHPSQARARDAFASGAFTWAALSRPDLKRYVAALRQVDCPEQTVRDIILAEVHRHYAPRERALQLHPEERRPWEMSPLRQGQSVAEQRLKIRALLLEKQALLKELLGVEIAMELPPQWLRPGTELYAGAMEWLPEEKRRQALLKQEDFLDRYDELRRKSFGFLEPEDREEAKRLRLQLRDGLAALMSPQELEDYEIKTSSTSGMLRERMGAFSLNEEEFRKIFRLTQSLELASGVELGRGMADPEDQSLFQARKQAERQLEKEVYALLGEERFAELRRNSDPAFQQVAQFAQENGLPRETAIKVYEIQTQIRAETDLLRRDNSLEPGERQKKLQQIQAQSEISMRGILGDEGYENLRQARRNTSRNRPNLPAVQRP